MTTRSSDVLSSPGPRTSQLADKRKITMPSFMAPAAPEGMSLLEAHLAPRGYTLGSILGHGAMGVVFAIEKPGQKRPTGLVAKLTFDPFEAYGTQTIINLAKKPGNRPWLRGVPKFVGMWMGAKKYAFHGGGMHGKFPIYAVIREDLLPIIDFEETSLAYQRTGAMNRLLDYEIVGERYMRWAASGDKDLADIDESKTRKLLRLLGKQPQMADIAQSLDFLLSAPMVIRDLHIGNIGFRPTETCVDWEDRYGNVVMQGGPKLVILDVGFSIIKRKPRIRKGMAANPCFIPPDFHAVLNSIPYG